MFDCVPDRRRKCRWTVSREKSHVTDWLFGDKGDPRLVAAGKLMRELARLDSVRRLLATLNRAGRLRSVDAAQLRQEEARLRAGRHCRSNDIHVLGLAIASGARTLATFDHALANDFRDAKLINRPRGRIYRDHENHGHLLCHTPASCGVRSAGNRRESQ